MDGRALRRSLGPAGGRRVIRNVADLGVPPRISLQNLALDRELSRAPLDWGRERQRAASFDRRAYRRVHGESRLPTRGRQSSFRLDPKVHGPPGTQSGSLGPITGPFPRPRRPQALEGEKEGGRIAAVRRPARGHPPCSQQEYPDLWSGAVVPLHPKVRERIDYEATAFPDLTRVPIKEGRRIVREMSAQTDRLAAAPAPLERVEDHSVQAPEHRVGVRLYFPKGTESPSPVTVYLHGGGWVFSDLETHDAICREIATRSRAVVAAVDYGRSPEQKFPGALEDAYAALRWLADPATAKRFDLRADRIAIGGDSAGGNMSAVLAVTTRDRRGPPLVGQVLICPVTAYYPNTPSYTANGTGFGFEAAFMPWMWDQYLSSPRQGRDHRVAPLGTPDLSHLAPALVLTAEYDLLRDEGEQYAERLRQAGIPVQCTQYHGMVHGFLDYRGIAQEGWDAIIEIAKTLRNWYET